MPRLLAMLVLVAVAVWFLVRRMRAATRDANPDQRSGATTNPMPERMHARPAKQRTSLRELETAKHWSDGEIRLGVEQFLFKVDEGTAQHPLARQLAQQPERTAAQVLQMLRDPELQMRLQRRRNGQTPWMRACLLLDEVPAAEHAEFARRLLDDAAEPVRLSGWLQLARIGDDVVVGDLERGAAESATVRDCLVRGLRVALAAGRVGDDGRHRVFAALTAHVDPVELDVLRLLQQLDATRASEEFAARGWAVG